MKLIYDQDINKQSYIENNCKILNNIILNKIFKSKLNKLKYNKFDFFKKKIKNIYLLDKNNLNNITFCLLYMQKVQFFRL